MRRTSTLFLFIFVLAITAFAIVVVWPSSPNRYLPGDFWPEGRGFSVGDVERETMRLGLDLRGGTMLVLEATPGDDFEGDMGQALDTARQVIERRVNEFGVAEAEVATASGNRIVVQVPGMSLEETEELIGATASLEFRVFNDEGELVPATGVIDGQEIAMTGEHLRSNTYPSRQGATTAVNFETTSVGAQLMSQITRRALQYPELDQRRRMLIFLDDELISDASINGEIRDFGQITGVGSFTDANNLSRQLNAGALPIPLQTIQSSEVSATLGEDAVLKSVHAGIVGIIAIMLFMTLYYRLPGLLASAALVVYVSLVLLVFKMWPVTLTLSGIAAFILSIGMAVDANILIFERMKEELRRGRNLNAAIDIGFSRAWSSIRDSNVSTLITTLILYWFGEQFGAATIQGFAITLAIGVLVSMFSAITVTRTFLKMVVGTPLAKNRALFNAYETKREDVRPGAGLMRFASRRWYYLGFAGALAIVSLIILAVPPTLRPGIEFTSGSVFTVEFSGDPVDQTELRDYLGELGYPEARVQGSGENTFVIRTEELEGAPSLDAPVGPVPAGEIDVIMTSLEERFGPNERLDFQTISNTVSSEIAQNTAIAVGAAALAIFAYIWLQFRSLPNPRRFGAAAVIALALNAVVVLGLFSLLGKLFGTEVDTAFITALLTVIGFSVHDTIVTFDRIREHLLNDPYMKFEHVIDAALTETMARSLATSVTLLLAILALLLIGGSTIQTFLIVLLAGTLIGTFSSIGVAAQVLVVWENGDIKRFFGKGGKRVDHTAPDDSSSMEPATQA